MEFHLHTTTIEAKPRKLNEVWTCELNQKLQVYYGDKNLYWYYRCLENARKVKKHRRKRYWVNQSEKYIKREFYGRK